MSNPSIQQALDYCLENPDGLSVPELLNQFPQYRAELSDMLLFASELGSITPPAVPASRRDAMKMRLMLATQERAAAQPIRLASKAKPARAARPLPWFLKPRWITAAAAIIALFFVWWSAARSLPDSPFYNVKLTAESVMLTLTGDPASKATLDTNIANARLYDLRAMEVNGTLAQSAPALKSYYERVAESNDIMLALSAGEPRARVATALYLTSKAGEFNLGEIEEKFTNIDEFPVAFRENLQQAEAMVEGVVQNAEDILVLEKIDPAGIEISPYMAVLLTPVELPPVATATPTNSPTATNTPIIILTPIVGIGQTPTGVVSAPSPTSTPELAQSPTLIAATSTSIPITVPTNTPQLQATPTAGPGTPTVVVTIAPPAPTSTPIPGSSATPTPTETSTAAPTTGPGQPTHTNTPTPPVPPIPPTGTPTQFIGQAPSPTLTSTPTSVVAPTQPPTSIPSTPVIPPGSTDTPTPIPTNTSVPTSTPTDTATSTPTHTPTDTPVPTPTDTPVPTPTEIPPSSVCNLKLNMVNAQCSGSTCADWTANITNEGSGDVEAEWMAYLEVRTGSGGFREVDTLPGIVTVGGGETTTIDGRFCDTFPPDTIQFRVRVQILPGGEPCNIPAKMSSVVRACTLH